MHTDKVKVLRDAYPFIADDLDIECEDGWFDIIKSLCDELMQLREPFLTYIKLSVIKQRFGILCVYYSTEEYLVDWVTDIIHNALAKAKAQSKQTCELCGQPGKLHQKLTAGFTRCDDCL